MSAMQTCVRRLCTTLLGLLVAAAAIADDKMRDRSDGDGDAEPGGRYAERADVRQFAAEVAARHGMDESWVQLQLRRARRNPTVARLIMPPSSTGTAKDWGAYRARLVEPMRIRAGVQFWQTHQGQLAKAEALYGVPAQIVVGIIGIETFYGRMTGNFRVLDALATLAFDFPPGRRDRSEFFRDELEQLLVWSTGEGMPAHNVRGSYAGAIGLPQFMPSSINRYAVDFDGNGHIDLAGSEADAIGSVAHYLAAFGWQPGMPTHYPVTVPQDSADRATLLEPDIVPSFSAEEFAERGALLDAAGKAHAGPLALVELRNGDAEPSYVAGTQNFYVVTRYNWSSYYALAVIELAAAIAAAR